MKPGVHDIPHEAYHADPAPAPSLSSSIAKVLLNRSPRHAWTAHPRLNPHYAELTNTKFDLGSAAHAYLLRDDRGVAVIDAADWRTKAAKEARAEAYADGRIPLLAHQFADVLAMVKAARAQLAVHRDASDAFHTGAPERTLIWREPNGIWCRARLDWLPDDAGQPADDYKTTATSVRDLDRLAANQLWEIQAAFYLRGLRALGFVKPEFRFVVQENAAPYALMVGQFGPGTLEIANRKVQFAVDTWARCLERGEWPGYEGGTVEIGLPPYHEAAWLDREDRGETSLEIFKTALQWQAPDPTHAMFEASAAHTETQTEARP